MKKNRKLNIPIYETVGGPDVDGIYEAREAGVESDQAQPQPESGPSAAQTQDQRERWDEARRAQEQEVHTAAAAGDPSAQLKLASRQAGMDLMSGLRRSGICRPGVTRETQRARLTGWQQAHSTAMVFSAIRPLRGGLSAAGVLETVGMSTMMLMLSPEFRTQAGSQISDVHGAVTNRIARLGEHKALGKEQGAISRGGSRQDLSDKWVRRLEKYERLDRHGLHPMTADSAALMEIGIAENAYAEMRAPGADPEFVAKQHKSALAELHTLAQRDGIESSEVSNRARSIVGARLQSEPHLAQVFGDLAHGRFVQNQGGQFADSRTGLIVDRGSFAVRAPMRPEAHGKAMEGVFTNGFATALNSGDVEAVESQMYVFTAGLYTEQYPEAVGNVNDPGLRQRLGRCQGMFSAMTDDGMSGEDSRQAYSDALIGAIGTTAAQSPEFAAQWNGEAGDAWRKRLKEQMREFAEFGDQAQAKSNQGFNPEDDNVFYQSATAPEPAEYDGEPVDAEFVSDPADQRDSEFDDLDDDDQIIDAEVVEDDVRPEGAGLPSAGAFSVPVLREGEDPNEAMLESMSDFMGRDIYAAAHSGSTQDLAGNSWLPRSVYSTPEQSIVGSALREVDGDVRERILALLGMREEMGRLGMPAAQQNEMFAAAYVRGLEKNVLADPTFEQVARQSASAPGSKWQEVEFARSVAQGHTAQTGSTYHGFVSGCGMDPEELHAVADSSAVNFGQVHQAQAQFARSVPRGLGGGNGVPLPSHADSEQARRQRQRRATRYRVSRENDLEDSARQEPTSGADTQFSLVD